MNRKELYALFLVFGLSIDPFTGGGQAIYPSSKPVLQVDTPYPTADKPQSKLWYSDNSWWALLPRAAGPSLWQRTAGGWIEHPDVGASLKGVPGRADVWPDEDGVTAVGVDPRSLTVYRLERKGERSGVRWKAKVLAVLSPPFEGDSIETATIGRDKRGRWWVAADAGGKVCVWNASPGGRRWSKPYILAEGIDKDDICSFAVLPEGVAVIWSDQVDEAVRMRIHRDSSPAGHWEEVITIDSGNSTADDHIRTSLSPDGTLWVATKNSLDEPGEPQLVLRVRSPEGQWRNFAYASREAALEPSRAIVLATENPDIVLAGHTVYNRRNPYWGEIVFGHVDTLQTGMLADVKAAIVPDTAGWTGINRINDVTGPRKPFPMDVPWIILASDKDGRVYEADLRRSHAAKLRPAIVTEPVRFDSDDPAIWIDTTDLARSLILGTDKHEQGALYVYDLNGKIIKEKVVSGLKRPNNVDVMYGLIVGGKPIDIAVITERSADRLRVFRVPDMEAIDNGGIPVFEGEAFRKPMGIALYKRPSDGNVYAIVGRKDGPRDGYLWQYLLEDDGTGKVTARKVREFGHYSGNQEIEAIAVDNDLGYVYYSDEGVGVRKYYADPDSSDTELALFATEGFARDHEGICIYAKDDGTGYILVSDQQADKFHLFTREGTKENPHDHRLVKIVSASTRESDGCEVTSLPLNALFPGGLFVAMSNDKTFHYYSWKDFFLR